MTGANLQACIIKYSYIKYKENIIHDKKKFLNEFIYLNVQTSWIITSCLELRPKKSTSTSSSSLPLQLFEDIEFSLLFILESSPSSSDEPQSLYADKKSDNF